jgi:hypothetical protein
MDPPNISLRIVLAAASLTVSAALIHLVLRGRGDRVLVQDERDWRALGAAADRMLFWCGGAIHGCRCESNELHFAIGLAQAPIAQVVRHLSGGYAGHLRRRYGWAGGIFRRYLAIPVDAELYCDDLVVWLHRPRNSDRVVDAAANPCWTADAAYRKPGVLPWVSTKLMLEALGGSGIAEYRRRMMQPVAPQVIALFKRPSRSRRHGAVNVSPLSRVDVHRIVSMVAAGSGFSYEDMFSGSRRRSLTKANAVATVLSVRHGASAAAMARLFRRSRSTLSELVEHYRQTQPHLYVDAETALVEGFG